VPFFVSHNWTKITTRATFSHICSASIQQRSTQFLPKIHAHVIHECANFVNFGLLSTKWEFFKLEWCLHRGKYPLYARAFSLSCCCLKHLYRQGGHHVVLPSVENAFDIKIILIFKRLRPLYFYFEHLLYILSMKQS